MPQTVISKQIEELEANIHEKKKQLAELRKSLPEKQVSDYSFITPSNQPVQLSELFGDKDELLIVHNMGKACAYCTVWADGFSGIYHHIARKAAFVLESPDAPTVLADFTAERHWTFPVVSSANTTFKEDMGFAKGKQYMPGVSVIRKDENGMMYQGATSFFGPGDDFCAVWPMFDLLPSGYSDYRPSKELNERAPFRLTNNIAVQVKDYDKALDFYQNVIGMSVSEEMINEKKLTLGGLNIYVENQPSHEKAGQVFFEYSVKNFAEVKETLEKAGCVVTKVFSEKSMMYKDPYGLQFHLFEGTK
ncbi:hypothetical protein GCM10008967_13100 [Bacillus carboniphilus]|uniref:VOC domain-containing protein n=1 Tax=Bacillus carboniphilus TaxID=86663 RepID=A0ABP3FRK9_9BACI